MSGFKLGNTLTVLQYSLHFSHSESFQEEDHSAKPTALSEAFSVQEGTDRNIRNRMLVWLIRLINKATGDHNINSKPFQTSLATLFEKKMLATVRTQ